MREGRNQRLGARRGVRPGKLPRPKEGPKTCVFAKRTHLQTLHFMRNILSGNELAFAGRFLQMGSFSVTDNKRSHCEPSPTLLSGCFVNSEILRDYFVNLRKFDRMVRPSCVRMDSGWNWTPQMGYCL